MSDAGLVRTGATITGIPLERLGALYPEDPALYAKTAEAPAGNRLLLLEFDAEGVTDIRKQIVFHRSVLEGPLCGIDAARTAVVGTAPEWETLLTDAGLVLPECPERGDPPPAPLGKDGGVEQPWIPPEGPGTWCPWEIDFDREMVVAVFAGEMRSTGYGVWIHRVLEQDDGSLVVQYCIVEPSEHQPLALVPTTPFAIAAIGRTEAGIRFELVDPPVREDGVWIDGAAEGR
jgi:hypothetical protein